MFNAIFGNFLFSRTTAQQEENENGAATAAVEAGTQTSVMANISTQTNSNNNESSPSTIKKNVNKKSTDPTDWVIVDPNEEAERLNGKRLVETQTEEITTTKSIENENLVDMHQKQPDESHLCYDVKTREEMERTEPVDGAKEADDEVMLGSFFDRNENCGENESEDEKMSMTESDEEEEEQQQQEKRQFIGPLMPTTKEVEETWLITPLPCLTSITSSQRSIVDNGTLENLLIEHPSMSIYMSATSASCSDKEEMIAYESKMDHPKQHKPLNNKNQKKNQKSKSKTMSNNKNDKQAPVALSASLPIPATPVAAIKQQKEVIEEAAGATIVIKKSVAEKRKEAEKSNSNSDLANTSVESIESVAALISLRKKDGKKNKKSAAARSHHLNKENMQVKSLLMNDVKKCVGQAAASVKLDCTLTNKNQMKRNNKNTSFSNKNANKKQRKYHNLQQPTFFSNNSNQQF